MNANLLDSNVKEDARITFTFGKNGWGLSDEFISIGKRIKELSQSNNVYLKEAIIDTTDDVYDLVFELHPHDEPKPKPMDCLEERIVDLMEENKQLRKEIEDLNTPKQRSL